MFGKALLVGLLLATISAWAQDTKLFVSEPSRGAVFTTATQTALTPSEEQMLRFLLGGGNANGRPQRSSADFYAQCMTYLEYAAATADMEVIRLLLQGNADPNLTDPDPRGPCEDWIGTPLTAAIGWRLPAFIRRSSGDQQRRVEIVKLLLANHADPNILLPRMLATALGDAARMPEGEPLVRALLEGNAQPDIWGYPSPRRVLPEPAAPLAFAAATGSIESMRLLHIHGASVDALRGRFLGGFGDQQFSTAPLVAAIASGNPEKVAILIDWGSRIDISIDGNFPSNINPLMLATCVSDDAMINSLVKHPNIRSIINQSRIEVYPPALDILLGLGRSHAAKDLIEAGARPNLFTLDRICKAADFSFVCSSGSSLFQSQPQCTRPEIRVDHDCSQAIGWCEGILRAAPRWLNSQLRNRQRAVLH